MTAPAHNAGGYHLTLANGIQWLLTTPDAELQPWLDQLAAILRLQRGAPHGARQLVFRNAESRPLSGHGPGGPAAPAVEPLGPGWNWADPNPALPRAWKSADGRDFVYLFPATHTRHADLHNILMWAALVPIYLQTIMAGGLPLHAALAEVEGRGVLFAAAGGGGKSTCASRLPAPWRAHCDDTALAVRLPEGGYRVHPFPTWTDHLWRGRKTTWPAQQHVPLAAIFFLEQARLDRAVALPRGEAAMRILGSTRQLLRYYWDDLPRAQKTRVTTATFHNACAVARAVPAFKLHVSLGGRFWEEVEAALRTASV